MTTAGRTYGKLRDIIECRGGTLTFQRRGSRYGVWILSLHGKRREIPAEGKHSIEVLDRLYIPKILHPTHFEDYSNELIANAEEKLLALLEVPLEEEMPAHLEAAFHQKALEIYETAKRECGYNATRFLQKIRKDGGLQAAKAWLRVRSGGDKPAQGFLKLLDYGRLDISLEAAVLQAPWNTLFTQGELAVARKRLQKYGNVSGYVPVLVSAPLTVGEEEPGERFSEGQVPQVLVNAYERNLQARAACIDHYGARCYVCRIDFGERYGPTAKGFIHVHHLCPLSSIGQEYEVDPVADLRPVCPNCHAVIHLRKQPPFSIEEVRRMLRKEADVLSVPAGGPLR